MDGKRCAKAVKTQDEEINTLHTRLSDLEIELDRRNVELKTCKSQREQIVGELNHFQKELKNAKSHQAKAEDAEAQAKSYAEEMKARLKKLEASAKDSSANNKSLVSQLQQEISKLKSFSKEIQGKLESAQEESWFKDDFIKQVEDDKERIRRDYSSKLANLEQALQAQKSKEREIKLQLKEAEDQVMSMQNSDDHYIDKKSDSMKLSSLLTTPQKFHNVGQVENELEDLKAENQKLKKDYEFFHSNYTTVCEKSKAYKQSIAEGRKEVADLQQMLDALGNEKYLLEQQVEELKMKLGSQEQSDVDEQKKREQLEQTIDRLRHQLTQSKEELNEKTVQLQQSNQLVEELKLELQTAHKKSTGDQPDVQQLYQEMLQLQDELESARSQATVADTKIASLIRENSSLLACKEEMGGDNDVLRNQVKSLETDFADLHKKFTALTSVHDQLVESFEKSSEAEDTPCKTPAKPLTVVEELHGKLKSVGKENKVLKHENKSVASSRDLLQVQLKGAKWMIEKLKRELGHIESTSSDIESDLLLNDATLRNTLEELKSLKDAVIMKQAEIDVLTTRSTSLQARVDDTESQLEQMIKKADELEKENFELTYSLSLSQEKMNSVQNANDGLSNKVGKLEERYCAVKEELGEKEDLVKELILSNDLMESENTSLLSQINSLTRTIKEKTNNLFTAQDKLNAQKVTASESEKMIATLDQTLLDAQQAKQSYEEQVKQFQTSLTSTKERLALSKADNFELQGEVKSGHAKVKLLEKEKGLLEVQVKKTLQDIETLNKQKVEVEIQMSCAIQAKEKETKNLQRQLQARDWECQRLVQEQTAIKRSYEELQKTCSVMEGRCTTLQDGYAMMKQESLATGEDARLIQQHVQTLQQRCDQLQLDNGRLKDEVVTANEEKRRQAEVQVKLMQQNAKVKQLMKTNDHLNKKYRLLQEDFENIQADKYDPSPPSLAVTHHSEAPDDGAKQSTSSDRNKVLFAVQNTMTVSYK